MKTEGDKALDASAFAERLRRELFHDDEGNELERAYRRGWNDRARSLICELLFPAPLAEGVVQVDLTETGGEQ